MDLKFDSRPCGVLFSTGNVSTGPWTCSTAPGKARSGWFPTRWRRATCSILIPAARSAPIGSCYLPSTRCPSTPRKSCPSSSSSLPASAHSRHCWHCSPTSTRSPWGLWPEPWLVNNYFGINFLPNQKQIYNHVRPIPIMFWYWWYESKSYQSNLSQSKTYL